MNGILTLRWKNCHESMFNFWEIMLPHSFISLQPYHNPPDIRTLDNHRSQPSINKYQNRENQSAAILFRSFGTVNGNANHADQNDHFTLPTKIRVHSDAMDHTPSNLF
jgi:hypothetical protein